MQMQAAAKLNLFLHITGKREDGYHLLESLAGFVNLADVIRIEPQHAGPDILEVCGQFAHQMSKTEPTNNLVMKAAQMMRAHAPTAPAVKLVLEKNIPIGGGLGGGSVDAAATLTLLSHYWKISLSQTQWQNMALRLGADVPIALVSQPAVMSGVGEVISTLPCPLPAGGVLLVNPGTVVSTASVFNHHHAAYSAPLPQVIPPCESMAGLAAWLQANTHNDLEPASIALAPVIQDVLNAIQAKEEVLLARMSGSGSTCFALFNSIEQAHAAANALHADYPHWWVHACGWSEE